MSLIDTVMERLDQLLARRIDEVRPFRATVASVSSGMVTIKRAGITTAETELRALVYGHMPAVNDEVLCVPVNGKPVVVGKVQRATPGAMVLPSGVAFPSLMGFSQGPFAQDNDTFNTITTTTTEAFYLGRAWAGFTSVTVRHTVSTAVAGITWAEIAIGTSAAIAMNGAASITTRGYLDMSAVWNSTGLKAATITTTGITAGDNLWLLVGNQATTAVAFATTDQDILLSGVAQVATARPSTMGSPTAFAVQDGATPICFWTGA